MRNIANIIVFLLLLPYSIIIGSHIGIVIYGSSNSKAFNTDIFGFFEVKSILQSVQFGIGLAFIVLFLLFFAINFVINRYYFHQKQTINGFIALVLLFGIFIFSLDERPQQFTYGLNDLTPTQPNQQHAFRLFYYDLPASIFDETDEILRMPQNSPEEIYLYRTEISSHWNEVKEARSIIVSLNGFSQIPCLLTPSEALAPRLIGLNRITDFYIAYAQILIKDGRTQEGIEILGDIYATITKALPYSRYLLYKILLTNIAQRILANAFEISLMENIDNQDRELLLATFSPLSDQAVSMRDTLISERLFMMSLKGKDVAGFFCAEMFYSKFDCLTYKALYLLSFKPHRTHHFTNNYFEGKIEQISDHYNVIYDTDISDLKSGLIKNEHFSKTIGNTLGWILLYPIQSTDLFSPYFDRVSTLKVHSDLFNLSLLKQLESHHNIEDYACPGKEYAEVDTPPYFKSHGSDCVAGTSDDISLHSLLK